MLGCMSTAAKAICSENTSKWFLVMNSTSIIQMLKTLYYNRINNHSNPCVPGGDSKTLMLVQISPSDHDIGETLSSLNFATRVRGVELGPAKKQIDMSELQKFKTMVSL